MFIPPYPALLRALGITTEQLDSQEEVKISAKLLKLLIKAAVLGGDVDESSYLAANADVREALAKRTIASARYHYVNFGYFEGRRGGVFVDDNWYLRQNPDVAQAIRARKIASASEHYFSSGSKEFRAPNASSEECCLKWKTSARGAA